jgi:hypothetical protein
LSSDSGAPTGLSEVRWTRTTVGGPNYLGGSVTEITTQCEQYGVTVHLFIGTRCSPDKITSMPLTSTLNHNANYQGLSSLFSLRSVSSFIFVNMPSRSSFSHSFGVHPCCLRAISSYHTPSSQSRSFL